MWCNFSLVVKETQVVKSLFHCVFSLHLHLVLVTKDRRRCIDGPILERLRAIFENLCEPDHVHLLLSVNPKVAPSVLVNKLQNRLITIDPQGIRYAGGALLSEAGVLEPIILRCQLRRRSALGAQAVC